MLGVKVSGSCNVLLSVVIKLAKLTVLFCIQCPVMNSVPFVSQGILVSVIFIHDVPKASSFALTCSVLSKWFLASICCFLIKMLFLFTQSHVYIRHQRGRWVGNPEYLLSALLLMMLRHSKKYSGILIHQLHTDQVIPKSRLKDNYLRHAVRV